MKMKSTQQHIQKQAMNPVLLTPIQLKSRQQQLLVIDVRGWLEYVMGHVPGAQRLSRDRILKTISKDQPIAITCLSGHRSAIVAQWLVSQGYQSSLQSARGFTGMAKCRIFCAARRAGVTL
jgi:thiosulfate sulfurtransferase